MDQKFGTYDVIIIEKADTITITPESDFYTSSPVLKVVCLVAPDDLATCEANAPLWKWTASFDDANMSIRVFIHASSTPHTFATISLVTKLYLAAKRSSSLTGNRASEWVNFKPSRVPSNLKLTPPGGGRFDLTLIIGGAPADRQEQPADKADIHVDWSTAVMNADDRNARIAVFYKGPRADLTYSISRGPTSAQFEPSVAGGFPFPLIGDGGGPVVTVTWNAAGSSARGTLNLVAQLKGTPPPKPVAVPVTLIAR